MSSGGFEAFFSLESLFIYYELSVFYLLFLVDVVGIIWKCTLGVVGF